MEEKGLGKSGKRKEGKRDACNKSRPFWTSAHFVCIIGLTQLSFQCPIKSRGVLFCMTDYAGICLIDQSDFCCHQGPQNWTNCGSYCRRFLSSPSLSFPCFHLLRCILFLSTLREHKQSPSDEILWVRFVNPSRAHLTEKAGRFVALY